jgi:hypothetical protein
MHDATPNVMKTVLRPLMSGAFVSGVLSLCLTTTALAGVAGMRVGDHAHMTRVVIDMDGPHRHAVTAQDGSLRILLADGAAEAADYAGVGVVRRVHVDSAGQVTIDTTAVVGPAKVFTLPPDHEYPHHRLVVDLPHTSPAPVQAEAAAASSGEQNISNEKVSINRGVQYAAAEPQVLNDASSSAGKSAAELWAEEGMETPPQENGGAPGSVNGKSAAELWAEEDMADMGSDGNSAAAGVGLFEGWSLKGYAEVEGRFFPQDSRDPDPKHQTGSVAAEPSITYAWAGGNQQIVFTPFGRADTNDGERTHADIRELKWIGVFDRLEVRAGIDKFFWGVTESVHLVDVINQDDTLEDIDREDKLGQPLVSVAYDSDIGIFRAIAMPYFRNRQFAGMDGRPRGPIPISKDEIYGDGDNRWRFDWALRWSHVMGPVDMAVSHFHGRRRDPLLLPAMTTDGLVLVPYYDVIDQTGVELQATLGAMLLKFEGIHKSQAGENQLAAVGGFEYTFYNIMEGASDLGVLAEYLWDERGRNPDNPFQDDLFVALRWTANDVASTTLLAGAIFDLGTSAKFINIEGSRRFGEHWKLSVDARVLVSVPVADPLYPFADDDFIQVKLQYYF